MKSKNFLNKKELKYLHERKSNLTTRRIHEYWEIQKKQEENKIASDRMQDIELEIDALQKKNDFDHKKIQRRVIDITEQKSRIAQIRSDIKEKQKETDEYSVMLENIVNELRNQSTEFVFFKGGKETAFSLES